MNILVVHSELGVLRGGGENFTRNLFVAFSERGHSVSAAFVADSRSRYPIKLPEEIHPLPLRGRWSRKLGQQVLSGVAGWLPRGSQSRDNWTRLQEAICWRTVRWHDERFARRVHREFSDRWNEFDAVYVHGSPLLASQIARYCPTVLRLPGPLSADWASVLKAVHVVCANGDVLMQTRVFLGDHAIELPVGLAVDVFKPGPTSIRTRLGWTDTHWVIGYVGRLAYVKGIDLLARAFSEIRKSIPHARLLIVGSGEEESKLHKELSVELASGLAHIESDVSHESLADWYRAMDLFAMPSRYENFSNAVIEALACGVPFLVSDVGGNRSLMESKGGWIFTQGLADSLTKTLRSISEQRNLARDRGVSAGGEIRHRYSWEASAKRLESIFKICLTTKVGAACRP